ncbi:MAG: hypothetical protein ABF254_01600 [Octadecabacter sp.]
MFYDVKLGFLYVARAATIGETSNAKGRFTFFIVWGARGRNKPKAYANGIFMEEGVPTITKRAA